MKKNRFYYIVIALTVANVIGAITAKIIGFTGSSLFEMTYYPTMGAMLLFLVIFIGMRLNGKEEEKINQYYLSISILMVLTYSYLFIPNLYTYPVIAEIEQEFIAEVKQGPDYETNQFNNETYETYNDRLYEIVDKRNQAAQNMGCVFASIKGWQFEEDGNYTPRTISTSNYCILLPWKTDKFMDYIQSN